MTMLQTAVKAITELCADADKFGDVSDTSTDLSDISGDTSDTSPDMSDTRGQLSDTSRIPR